MNIITKSVENRIIAGLACIALLTFFFPLVAIHLPIVGDKGISGYDAVSKIFTFTKDLTPDLSSSGSTGSAATSVRLPLSLQLVWLIPALILVALACALMTVAASLRGLLSLAKNGTTFGTISGIAAVVYVGIVNTSIHNWLQHMISSSMKDLQGNPFAGMAQIVGNALVNAVTIRPAAGLYVLTGCLAVAALVAHSRVLSVLGSQVADDERSRRAPTMDLDLPEMKRPHHVGQKIGLVGVITVFGIIPTLYLLHDRIPQMHVSLQPRHSAPVAAPSATVPQAAPQAPKTAPQVPGPVDTPESEDVAQMRQALSVTITGKKFVPKDYDSGRYSDWMGFNYVFKNTGSKDIHAFQGAVIVRDVLGNKIQQWHIKFDRGLSTGQSKTETLGSDFNQFLDSDQTLRDTAFSNLRFEWKPQTVLFADGTKLGKFTNEE